MDYNLQVKPILFYRGNSLTSQSIAQWCCPNPRHSSALNCDSVLTELFFYFKEKSATKKGQLHFIKVHVPWEVMLFYAEELNFKGPLKVRTLIIPMCLRTNKIMKSLIWKTFLQSSIKVHWRENFSFSWNQNNALTIPIYLKNSQRQGFSTVQS